MLSRREFLNKSGYAIVGAAAAQIPFSAYAARSRTARLTNPSVTSATTPATTPDSATVYLTFDDGPSPQMRPIVNHLGLDHQATFFLVGQMMGSLQASDHCIEALQRGHVLGNHTYSHPSCSAIAPKRMREEVERADELIGRIYAKAGMPMVRVFRFPYMDEGHYSSRGKSFGSKEKRAAAAEMLAELGYRICGGEVDSDDWRAQIGAVPVKRSIDAVLASKPNDIVVLHERPITAKVILPTVLSSTCFRSRALYNKT